jgi:hypothetical protein
LIVATAVLLGWLLVALTRSMLGDFHLPGLHPSPVESPAGEASADSPSIVAAPEPVAAEAVPTDDADAERTVYEHLYGRPKRSA